MGWLDELKEYSRKATQRNHTLPTLSWVEFDRLIAVAELLAKIKDDGTGSAGGMKRVWPLRAAHWREAGRLLSDERGKT